VINETQGILIWESGLKKKGMPKKDNLQPILTNFIKSLDITSAVLGSTTILIVCIIGSSILLFIFLYLGITLYFKQSNWTLVSFSLSFGGTFYFFGDFMMKQGLPLWFISYLDNCAFLILLLALHALLIISGLQKTIT
jgi:hypothetical protein